MAIICIVCLTPLAAQAQVSELLAIRDAASSAAERSRTLAASGGAEFHKRALDSIRRSCAGRQVTRLDEIAPSSVNTNASDATVKSLLEVALATQIPAEDPAVEAVDDKTSLEFTTQGLVLRSGQVRTTREFAISRDSIGTIEIEAVTTGASHLLLGWNQTADAPRLRRNNARIELIGDGRVHTYSIDAAETLARGLDSGESVRRFFIATRGDAPLEIRALRVLSRAHRYAGKAWGTTHEVRGTQWRSVLYARPRTELTYEVNVPTESPVFETGLAVLTSDGVLEFEVAIHEADVRTVLLKRLVKEAAWEDASLDLSAWSGKRVKISLAVRGTADAVALWSSPLLRPKLGIESSEPIVVILEDALRPDRLSVYGGPVPAPAHERIASSGVVFERAFAQATQTRSSVPSMMTSLLPSTNGTWDFSDALSDRFVTLAEALRACGFATASFVQNGNAGPYAGLAQGFDVLFTEENFGPHAADILFETSVVEQWIARQAGRPWFAYVHLLDPHGPYDPVERPDLSAAASGEEMVKDKSLDASWLQRPTAEARRLLYDAELAANDLALGGFLDRLQARGDLDRAVVAVVADHGEFLGEHGGMWRHHPPGHVEVARVPFLLRAPGAKAARIAEPVGLLDLMPTLLELAGADRSSLVMHGASLAGTLRGQAPPKRAIPAEEMLLDRGERRARGCGSFATADSLWLLSCTHDEDFTPGRMLLHRTETPAPLRRFDLRSTPLGVELPMGTLTGPAVDAIVARALEKMEGDGIRAWKTMAEPAAAGIRTEPATTERLRALGYLE